MAEEEPKKKSKAKKKVTVKKDTKKKKKKRIGFAVEETKEEVDEEAKLIKLSRFSPLRFRHAAQHHLKQYKELIYDLASHDDDGDANAKHSITQQRFSEIFDGKIGKDLCKEIFIMIYDGTEQTEKDDAKQDDNNRSVTQFDIIKFMEGKKVAKHVRAITVKDADWVLQHLKDVQFADLDRDNDGKIVIDDFYAHFCEMGVSKQRVMLMFQMLDKNDDRKISLFEYEGWRRKQTASDLQSILNVTCLHYWLIDCM
eukprot:305975_1